MKNAFIILFFFGFSSLIFCQEIIKIDDLRRELQKELIDTAKVSIILNIAHSFKNIDSSKYYLNKALKLADRIESKPHVAKVLYNIALNYGSTYEYQKAINYFIKAASAYKKINNLEQVANVYNYIGYFYYNLYSEEKSIEYYMKSIAIYKNLKNNVGLALNYVGIGHLYYQQENYVFAKKHYNEALSIYKKLEDNIRIADCYTNLGNSISDEGDLMAGLEYYEKSIAIDEKLGDQYGVAMNYNNIGYSYINLKEYEKALNYFNKALDISKKINNNNSQISLITLNLAVLQNLLKNYQEAIVYSNESLVLAKQLGNLEYAADNLMSLSNSYKSLGNLSKALDYSLQYIKIKDSLLKKDKIKKVLLFSSLNELETSQLKINDLANKNVLARLKSESEKRIRNVLIMAILVFLALIISLVVQRASKRKAYNLLSQKNGQITKMKDEIDGQSSKLKQLNSTKDKFFSIIAHDLKNPHNSIAGFTDLMIENNEIYDAAKRLKFLKIIKESTAKVSSLLNNLLIWASSQSGNLKFNPKNINLAQQVVGVISFLEIQAINKDISILNKVEKNVFVKADANMLDTILRNLISNAIKFTQPKGEIQIYSSLKNNFVEITVKDNGVGMTEAEIAAIFNGNEINSTLGTSNEQGSGLGLILCKDFAESHGGKIWVESVVDEGSEFKFTLPNWND